MRHTVSIGLQERREAMPDVGNLGRNIARLRADRGWTQTELARRSGVTQSFISALEGGRRQDAEARFVQAIAKALGVTMDGLLREEAPHQ